MKYLFEPQEIKEVTPSKNVMIDNNDRKFPLNECVTIFEDELFDVEEYAILYSEDIILTDLRI